MPKKLTTRLSSEERPKFKMAATERGADIFSFQGSMADTDVLEELEREHREEIVRDA